MKSVALTFILFIGFISTVMAVSEPVCSYKNSQGDMIFLKYLPYAKRGQDYVDFRSDGICTKRAVCTETFTTQIEDCANHKWSCSDAIRPSGVFPACCIMC